MGGARHNLPAQPTGLIGRERDAAEALALLRRDDVRLLTVTGPAGVGKSRLAVELASRLLPELRGGTWLVDLTPIADARLVTATICQTLGLRETPGMPLLDSLRQYLADRQILLVLDNFEHVLSAAAVVSDILATCPGVALLATSGSRRN